MNTRTAEYPSDPIPNRKYLPPGPPELPIVGQSFRYASNIMSLFQDSARYGDVATVSTKPFLLFVVTHPDLIRDLYVTNHRSVGRGFLSASYQYLLGLGLVTADGPLHLRQRRLMQPQFHHGRVAGYARVMTEYASQHQQEWRDGQPLDIAREMSELTLHIVVKTLFGLDPPDTVRRIGAAFDVSHDYITVRSNQPVFLRKLLHRLPMPLTRRFKRAVEYLDSTVYGLIERHRQSGLVGDDLLSLLLSVRDEEAANPEDAVMTDQQVRDEVITLFAAGHETSAVALTWTWYLLATHPEIQARFHAELDEVLDGRIPVPEDLANLPMTERILTESMRLYPPIWSTGRMTYEPIELGGWKIPAGACLVAPQMIVHRDPRWFENPLEFQPDRWTPEFKENLPRFAYYPFGGGPRLCIGEGFAWMEAMLLLATIGQRWTMHQDPSHKLELLPLVSLRPKGGLPMFLERRR